MHKLFLLLCLLGVSTLRAQNSLTLRVVNGATGEVLAGANISIRGMDRTWTTDTTGDAHLKNLPTSTVKLQISYAGYETLELSITLPPSSEKVVVTLWPPSAEEAVIVRSTRTSRAIRNVPTRVETISLEEIDEKSNMRPSNVSMLLHESTGIQVQQTSATSANASIRLQGLDGRYTQLLKDGFSSFGNFASGLSVLEIPPLDLKQVEIIKGPASTLFGGGAIAGVVNFFTKTPKEKPENSLLLNQSNIGQSNLGFYSSARNTKSGYTFLALLGHQRLYDVDRDDFTELPRTAELTLHPQLFIYGKKNSTWVLGHSFSTARRTGGDVQVIEGKENSEHRYFEENNTRRNNTTIEWEKPTPGNVTINIKQAFTVFERNIRIPDYRFDGTSYNSFTDASLLVNRTHHALVGGINLLYDQFDEHKRSAANRDNTNFTAGVYLQDTWDISDVFKAEAGLRWDMTRYHNTIFQKNQSFLLPRLSLMIRINEHLTSRIGGGLGYKLPTLFTEQTESFQYRQVNQLNNVQAEKSVGSTADVNYKTRWGKDLEVGANLLYFFTQINQPLVLVNHAGAFQFENQNRPVQSSGVEANAKFIFRQVFKLFAGYTFTNARAKYLPGRPFLPLVPKHKLNTALIFEKADLIKLGLEAYYTGPQYLSAGGTTPGYWEFGAMAEKIWPRWSLFINFENFTDTRQSRYKPVVSGTHENPGFDEIWTHTEGIVINGGMKIRF